MENNSYQTVMETTLKMVRRYGKRKEGEARLEH